MRRTIAANLRVVASTERVAAVLLDDPARLFGDSPSAEERRARCFRAFLLIDLGSGASARQEVAVQVGPGSRRDDAQGVVLPLSWHAAGRANLFPTFTGELASSAQGHGTELSLRGSYVVPLGPIGRYADRLAGHRAAEASCTLFLTQIAQRLEAEVLRRIDGAPYQPAAKPVSFYDLAPVSRPRSTLLEKPDRGPAG